MLVYPAKATVWSNSIWRRLSCGALKTGPKGMRFITSGIPEQGEKPEVARGDNESPSGSRKLL